MDWTDTRDNRGWKVKVNWPNVDSGVTNIGIPKMSEHPERRRIVFTAADALDGPYGVLLDEGDVREAKDFSPKQLQELLDRVRM